MKPQNSAPQTVLEKFVWGWESELSYTGPHRKQPLRTVFVELSHPPRDVEIPGLSINTVPISAYKHRIQCRIPIDEEITIDCEQL